MSVVVSNVSKWYGSQKALDEVSFQIGKGEVLAFLGPNGAGKSTMMKIITTFIAPTSGSVKVCDFDIIGASLEVRKRVGYLPEHNPLYVDMYVREYLQFIAGLHRIKNSEGRVKEMIALTGLEPEQHKKIGALSRGYRQRVGLAQAIIHDPEVLILDEPTSGLDPNQLIEIRALIRQLGKEKTVMLSTHIMQEVEAICDKVIIIKQGKIVANEKASGLRSQQSAALVRVEFREPVQSVLLQQINGVLNVADQGANRWVLTSREGEDIRQAIFQFAVEHQLTVLTISREERDMEQVFRELTQNKD
ncbi:MAG: gliding motility-associated ABC transporter ATP-binding subunit GldA [Bacteroidia bacterium]|nr:gliding motility-associated ABC transporter ATP-binding subunit GldA [Bacteroidia bacterium]MCC6767567.1 gliding motility-associated ABC transporter ATP-binding subunit GldA [Bacteroidia bacterium]